MPDAELQNYTLEQVTVLSRHNIRSPLSLNTPPMIVPLHFTGVTEVNGMIPEKELEGLFEEKINAYYQMTEFYEAEELQNAA